MLLKCVNSGSKNGNCYILESDTETLILDAGVRYKDVLKALEYNVSKVKAVLISHEHLDHTKYFRDFIKNGVNCHGCAELQTELEYLTGEKIISLKERVPKQIGSFTVIPFYVPHTTRDKETGALVPCPNYGYLIEQEEMGKALYMTDVEYCPFSFRKQRINHLIIESNYCADMVERDEQNFSHRLKGHCSLDTCKGIVATNKTSDLRKVTLIHLSDSDSNPERMKAEVQEVAGKTVQVNIAEKGMEPILLSRYPF